MSLNSFTPVTTEEVIRSLNKSLIKACELDPLPKALLKRVGENPDPHLTSFMNESINSGTFSNILKQALLLPLLKKVNLDCIFKNYRQVSNLSFISKLLERINSSQLVQYTTSTGNNEPLQLAYTKTIQLKQHYSKQN